MIDHGFQPQRFTARLRGQEIAFYSKPGIPDWDQVSPSTRLLAEHTRMPDGARVLLMGGGPGALVVSLKRLVPDSQIWVLEPSIVALDLCQKTLELNRTRETQENVRLLDSVSVLPEQAESFDTAIINLPKGRKLAQRWLVEAYLALRPGGHLYLAGANEMGIQPVIRDAQTLYGGASILDYQKGNRVARLVKPATDSSAWPSWASEPGIKPGSWIEFDVDVLGQRLHLHTLPGVFSAGRLDEGTALLLTQLQAATHGRVLDLGCGYGLVGILASKGGAEHVDLVDASLLAVASARENLKLEAISNAEVLPSDSLEAVLDRRYSLVATNPPFHVGKDVDYGITDSFIRQAWQVLEPGGNLLLVANRFIPYDQTMQAVFGKVERLAQTGKYHLLLAVR